MAPALDQIYFYLTRGCNLACRHCWLAPPLDKDATAHPVLAPELFARAIEEALPLGLSTVKLTGGEPLLHPEISRLIDIAASRDLAVNLETNGVLMTAAIAGQLGALKRCFVSVSLDGPDPATHDAIRGVAGAFDGACRAVSLLATAGIRPQIIMSLLPSNIDCIEDVVRLAEALGAASVKFNIVQPTARGKRLAERGETVSIPILLEKARFAHAALARRTGLELFFDLPLAFRPLSRLASGNGCAVCGIKQILGAIADGHWALCGIGDHLPEMVFGRIGQDPLATLWSAHPVLTALREGLPERLEGICSQCLMRNICLGACVAQNFYRNQSLWSPFWFCEQAEALGLFPPSRLHGPSPRRTPAQIDTDSVLPRRMAS